MREVRDRLRALDQIEAPDLRERIHGWEPRAPRTEPLLKRAAIALLALIVAAAGIAFAVRALRATEPPTPPATAIENGLIVFSRGGPESGLYVMNGDGTGVRRLPSERGDADATWSPDGSRIAFVRFHDGNAGIFVMNADGSDARQLTHGGSDGSPAWSPDGTQIAFAREAREPGAEVANADIYAVNTDGTEVIRLTHDPLQESSPSWSPDGSRIAFVGYDEASGGRGPSPVRLYVMNQNGTDIRALGPENVAQPAWSADGSEIAYVDTETGSIMTIGPDGTGRRRVIDAGDLVGGVHLVYSPVWSPDGTKIAFMAGADAGNTHIYMVRRDGSGFAQLTNEPAPDAEPAWQPVQATDVSITPTPSEPTASITASASDVIPIEENPGAVSAVAYGFDSAWVASFDGSQQGWLTRLDSRTGETLAHISTANVFPTWEVGGGDLATGFGSVWMAGASSAPGEPSGVHAYLLRIDPTTEEVFATIDLRASDPADVAIDDTGVWVMSFGLGERPTMEVSRIDPSTNEVAATIPLDSWYGHHLFSVGGWIVASTNDGTPEKNGAIPDGVLNVIDPQSGTDVRTISVGPSAWPAAGDDQLWIATGDSLRRIDPSSGQVLERYEAPNTGDALAVGEGGVWFIDPEGRNTIDRFDPGTGSVDLSVRLPDGTTPIAMITSPGVVWVLNYEGSLSRIDLS